MKNGGIILIGGGGHCVSCIDVIEAAGDFQIAGIVDVQARIGESVLGYKIQWEDSDLPRLAKEYQYFLVTIGQIGEPRARVDSFTKLEELGCELPTIISPIAHVSKHATIGRGTIIMHQAIVNAEAVIGNNCIINTKALVEHNATIEDHCHISTTAVVNGGVQIGARTFYGSGAISKEYIEIPQNSFIKANSIVK